MSNIVVRSTPISDDKRFWVIRAGKDAVYYDHFRKNQLVAIGHTEGLNVDGIEGELSEADVSKLLKIYRKSLADKGETKSVISRQVGQVNQFLTLVKQGDTVLTITDSKVMVGQVTSKCYYDETELNNFEDDGVCCYFPLRINVSWSKSQARDYIPYIIDKSFRNTGTIFSISDHDKVKALNHWLYPIHFSDDEVRCSINIKSSEKLSNRELSNLSNVYNQLELLSSYIENLDILENASVEGFKNFLDEHSLHYDYLLTAQHAFMSPGYQFIQLKGSKLQLKAYALAFALLFNSNIVFAEEDTNDQVLTEKVVELVQVLKTEMVIQSIDSLKAEMQKQSIQDFDFEEPIPSLDAML
ncbi:hypothetical protein [Vibrio cholerae]|uniref:hypothetical protein n=1 Tax=Vibrio cholerae TaxID=666 RepID=UPI00201B2FDD|nr:hypothetical protein [Vibrio cholerae]EJI2329719.1 hypothetical protein [Vibrio cholerae]ELK6277025.1 hypothetical protein [Vibrio cholerae]MCL5753093.1 hypothetical protein [Vibrio cholerae]